MLISKRLELEQKVNAAGKNALDKAALDLLSKAVKLAPLDEGDLRRSGNVNPAKVSGDLIEASTGFATPYAVTMHEDLSYTPQEPETGPKYLEQPAKDNAKTYLEFIERELKAIK
jgi:hypothetical protein